MTKSFKLTKSRPLDLDENPAAPAHISQPRPSGEGIEYIHLSAEDVAGNRARKEGVSVVEHLRRAFSLSKYRGPSRNTEVGGMKRNQSDTRFDAQVRGGGGLNATKKLWSYPTLTMRDRRREEISFEMILKEEIPTPHPSPGSSKGLHHPLPRLGCHSKSSTNLERDADPSWPPLPPKPSAPVPPPKSTITSAQLASFRKVSAPILRRRPLPRPPATPPITDMGHTSFYQTQNGSLRQMPATIKLVTRPSPPPSPNPMPFGPHATFTTSTPMARRVHSASKVLEAKATRKPTATMMPRKPVPRFLDVPVDGDDGHISGVTAFTRSPPISTPKPKKMAAEFRSPHLATPPTPKYDVYADPFVPNPARRPPDAYDDSYEHYQNTLFEDVLNTWGLPLDLLAESASRSRRDSIIKASKSSQGSRPSQHSRPTRAQVSSKPPIKTFPSNPKAIGFQSKPSPLGERGATEKRMIVKTEPRRKHGMVKKFVSMDERKLRQPVGRVKDIVDIIEDRQGDRTSTPIRDLGRILHRPSSVSSDNLQLESKRMKLDKAVYNQWTKQGVEHGPQGGSSLETRRRSGVI